MPKLKERLAGRYEHPSTASARQKKQHNVSVPKGCVELGEAEFAAEFPDELSDDDARYQLVAHEDVDEGEESEGEESEEEGSDEESDGDDESGDDESDGEREAIGCEEEGEMDEDEGGVVSTWANKIVIGRDPKGQFRGVVTPSQGSSTATSGRKKRPRTDLEWLLVEGVSGGPEIVEVIPSFGGHRAMKLWSEPSLEGILTGQSRWRGLQDLRRWKLKKESSDFISRSGLGHLVNCISDNLDMPLLTAFIERWQPDTNTFMFPFGEMTIALHDVEEILKIAISGRLCTAPADVLKDPIVAACELFGKSARSLKQPYCSGKKAPTVAGKGILVNAIEGLVVGSESMDIQVQGYLLALLGQTLFVDKTGDRVMSTIFPLVSDLDEVGSFAWGAGTLAYLYRELGKASRAKCMQVAGCLTLLQIWIYEHFPCFRPRRGVDVSLSSDTPRACCWVTRKEPPRLDLLRHHRRTLDSLTPEMVTWLPYGDDPAKKHPMTVFTGFLRFMDVVEPYFPVRYLRQFGYRQVIPSPMSEPDLAHRPIDSVSYMVRYGKAADVNWNDPDAHTLNLDNKYARAIPSYAVDDTYLEWYLLRSHPRLINPSLDSEDVHQERGITDTEVITSVTVFIFIS